MIVNRGIAIMGLQEVKEVGYIIVMELQSGDSEVYYALKV